ncbi:MAG: phosphopyruvate hydratase [Candidatus Helarchaeota archaeon]
MGNIFEIKKIKARWILDSRGNPTVQCDVILDNNIIGRAAVPSGASTGEHEALELRDKDKSRFLGKGVDKAVNNVNTIIAPKLIGMSVKNQKEIDKIMLELDGTENKSKLGANAILSVSLASARAAALCKKVPLYQHLYSLSHDKTTNQYLLPVPMSNVINGGKHAGSNLAIQEFMIMPIGANEFNDALRRLSEVYHHLKNYIKEKYGKNSINVGDEGGFAPAIDTTREALDSLIHAIESAGYKPKTDFVIAMDAAASEFYKEGKYNIDGKLVEPGDLIDFYKSIINEYPIASLEDPFDENDYETFAKLTEVVGSKCLIVGDDLFVTQVKRLQKGIDMKAANALLLKVNQCGSLTESIDAAHLSYKNDFCVIVSHRSGETEDSFIADLVVGLCTGLIKTGGISRSERICKYNQILRINEELEKNAEYAGVNFKTAFKKFQ